MSDLVDKFVLAYVKAQQSERGKVAGEFLKTLLIGVSRIEVVSSGSTWQKTLDQQLRKWRLFAFKVNGQLGKHSRNS